VTAHQAVRPIATMCRVLGYAPRRVLRVAPAAALSPGPRAERTACLGCMPSWPRGVFTSGASGASLLRGLLLLRLKPAPHEAPKYTGS
jgi:hypothetical protein